MPQFPSWCTGIERALLFRGEAPGEPSKTENIKSFHLGSWASLDSEPGGFCFLIPVFFLWGFSEIITRMVL